jgi:tetratricopeptide (TPR) repeat protein
MLPPFVMFPAIISHNRLIAKMSPSESRAAWLCLGLLVIACGFLYQPGLTGALYYDDIRPLSGLANVVDFDSALYFISSEISGPLGRPLAMLSFLLHVADWPGAVENIFLFNVLLHLANGALVALLAYRLLNLRGLPGNTSAWIAVGTATLWMLMPLQASSSLIAVQRMATLSAFFVLAGLLIHVRGIAIEDRRPALGGALQAIGLGGFTLLAMLTKENGILLPVFALVIQVTLLADRTAPSRLRTLRAFAGGTALAIILAYLTYSAILSGGMFGGRDFNLLERIQTQPLILLEYLREAFAPRPYGLHPFHDGYAKVSTLAEHPVALFAAILWPTLAVLAIRFRRRYPVAAFAVLWFLAAHLLESTVLGLELYFEHRNYLALFGPCLAIAWAVGRTAVPYRRLAIAGFAAYLATLGAILFHVTSLWGDKLDAAETWFVHAYKSPRAAEHLALLYLEQGHFNEAYQIMRIQVDDCPQCLASVTQAALLACAAGDAQRTQDYFAQAEGLAIEARNVGGATSVLSAMHNAIEEGKCSLVDYDQLEALNRNLLRHQTDGLGALSRKAIHINLQRIAMTRDDAETALNHLKQAWEADNDRALGHAIVRRLLDRQAVEGAKTFHRDELCRDFPKHPVLGGAARKQCDESMQAILEAASSHSLKVGDTGTTSRP